MRKIVKGIIIAGMVFMIANVSSSFAVENEDLGKRDAITQVLSCEAYRSSEPADNDELFEQYIDAQLKATKASNGTDKMGSRLTGLNRTIYEAIKKEIPLIAGGDRTSTIFILSVEDMNLDKTSWTASELGVSEIIQNGAVTEDAQNAVNEILSIDMSKIVRALLYDCPYELYWFDKATGATVTELEMEAVFDGQEYTARIKGDLLVSFAVATSYAAGQYEVDTSHVDRVNHAVDKAWAIVCSVENNSDYEKLVAYREAICNLVRYDYQAVNDSSAPYGDSWQIISVFDEDASTNVVCEGYSKAFQYLCDLSSFTDDIACISVTGETTAGAGAGSHMWNIVNMDDGKNYLVDITNCDEGAIGANDQLFLRGTESGTCRSGYTVDCADGTIKYSYDENTFSDYTEGELTINNSSYPKVEEEHNNEEGSYTEGDWNYHISSNGKASITGYNGSEKNVVVPARIGKYRISVVETGTFKENDNIETITFSEGLVTLKGRGIDQCNNLKTVTLPATFRVDYSYHYFTSSSIPYGMINECEKLERVVVDKDNPFVCIYDGALYSKDMKILIYYPSGGKRKKAVVPDGVERIYYCAFVNAKNVEEVVLPEGLQYLDAYSFFGCNNLEAINIPDSVISMHQYLFCWSKIRELHIPSSAENIADGALSDMELLERFTIESNHPHFKVVDEVLYYMGTEDSPTTILIVCPAKCSQKKIEILDGTEEIQSEAFAFCTSIRTVIIPEGVKRMGSLVFNFCTGLEDIYFYDRETGSRYADETGDRSHLEKSMINGVSGVMVHGYPDSTAEEFTKNNPCGSYYFAVLGNEEEIISGKLSDTVFWEFDVETGSLCISGTGEVPDGQREYGLFGNKIRSITIKDGITSISNMRFNDNTNLETIELPPSLKTANYTLSNIKTIISYCDASVLDCIISVYIHKKPRIYYSVEAEGWDSSKWEEYDLIPFGEHDWEGDFTIDVEPSYTEPGYKSIHCKNCKKRKNVVEIPMLERVSISTTTISEIPPQKYTGKVKKPKPVVTDGDEVLKEGKDYTLSYKKNKDVGKATAIVSGTGKYKGEIRTGFVINPKGTSLVSVTKAKKAFMVKWKKRTNKMSSSRITGYQIQFSTTKTFTSDNKTVTVKGYSKNMKKIGKLKSKKKYFVRIRTYMKVNGSTYRSQWSDEKAVTIQ